VSILPKILFKFAQAHGDKTPARKKAKVSRMIETKYFFDKKLILSLFLLGPAVSFLLRKVRMTEDTAELVFKSMVGLNFLMFVFFFLCGWNWLLMPTAGLTWIGVCTHFQLACVHDKEED
jgi:hypothetical protein